MNQRIKRKLANRAAKRGHAIGREHNALRGKKMHNHRIKMCFTRVAIQVREGMKLALTSLRKAVTNLLPAMNALSTASIRQESVEDHVKDRIVNSVVMNAVLEVPAVRSAMDLAIAELTGE